MKKMGITGNFAFIIILIVLGFIIAAVLAGLFMGWIEKIPDFVTNWMKNIRIG